MALAASPLNSGRSDTSETLDKSLTPSQMPTPTLQAAPHGAGAFASILSATVLPADHVSRWEGLPLTSADSAEADDGPSILTDTIKEEDETKKEAKFQPFKVTLQSNYRLFHRCVLWGAVSRFVLCFYWLWVLVSSAYCFNYALALAFLASLYLFLFTFWQNK